MEKQRTWRRRNFFIKKDFQGKIILKFFLAILVGAIIFTAILSLFSADTITITYEDSYLKLDKTPKALLQEIIRAYGLYILLLGIIISGFSLFLSHRIAGPLYRLERSVEEITKGNLAFKIVLRKKDEARELADGMNIMIEALSNRIRDIRLNANSIHEEVLSLSKMLEDEELTSTEVKANILETLNSIEEMEKTLSFFRTDKG